MVLKARAARLTSAGPLSGNGGRFGHPCDYFFNCLAAFDVAAAVIQHAVLGERRHIQIRIMKIQCEQIPRLQILDERPIVAITGVNNPCRACESGRHKE